MYRELLTLRFAAASWLALLLAVSVASCADDDVRGSLPGPPSLQPASHHARVHFKGGTRLRNDLAQLLRLDPGEVCNEFGTKSCTESVHTVALGGVDAYENQLFTPSPTTSLTATLIVERVALSACRRRAEMDLAGGSTEPVLFRDVATAQGRSASLNALYTSALGRSPTQREREGFELLYEHALAEAPDAAEAGRSFATLSCFAVVTTVEVLFY